MIFYFLDSDNEYDELLYFGLSATIQQSCSKRKHILEHDYAITGLVLSLFAEIREDVAERLDANTQLRGLSQNFIYF